VGTSFSPFPADQKLGSVACTAELLAVKKDLIGSTTGLLIGLFFINSGARLRFRTFRTFLSDRGRRRQITKITIE